MIRGLYTSASGMQTQQNKNDALANNLANVNTTGYKSKQSMIRSFPDVLINATRTPNGANKLIGTLNQGVFVEENVPIFLQGDITDTGVASHMAIYDSELNLDPENGEQPKLFFTIEDKNGDRFYTRSGMFTEDASGQLVTPEGNLVLDDWNYPIQVDGRKYSVNDKGYIRFSDGETIRFGLTSINDLSKIENKGNEMYSYIGNEDLDYIDEEENYRIYQGKIERSNVDVNQTVTDMMTALRMYEANQNVIQSIDRTLEKAVNEIGRV